MSGPEVRKIFKVRTVRKPDLFLSGRQTFQTLLKIERKIKFVFQNAQFGRALINTQVTRPMLQRQQTELRLMVSKSIFNVDSKNVS